MSERPVHPRGVFRRSEGFVCRRVGRESILVPVSPDPGYLDSVYTLSPVAARVWSLLDREVTADEVVDTVCAEFEVDRETAAGDVHALLDDLAGVSLVSVQA